MADGQATLGQYTELDPTELTVAQLVNRGHAQDGEEALRMKQRGGS